MYLLITKRAIYHEGDGRSQTHPCPPYYETVDVVRKFEETIEGKASLDRTIDTLSESDVYELYKAKKLTVTKTVNYEIV